MPSTCIPTARRSPVSLIVLSGLSAHLVASSVQVSGLDAGAVSIRSVATRRALRGGSSAPSDQQQAMVEEQQDLEGHIAALEAKALMIRKVSEATPTIAIETSRNATTSEDWSAIWAKVADGLEDTERRIRQSRHRLEEVTASLAELRTTVLPPQGFEVVLEVVADHATEADLKLVYQVGSAHWQPLYDARLHTSGQGAQLRLTRRAKVVQASGENWTDVALSLSSSTLSASTAAPILKETSDVTGDSGRGISKPRAAPTALFSSAERDSAEPLAVTPFDASLRIPGRVSVASGTNDKLYIVGSRDTDVDMSVRTVPLVDKRAYLQVRFESTDPVALIPGEVELYRDGAFVGRTVFKGAAPGDQVTLGFGVDALVSVERIDVGHRERNTTVVAGTASVERAFRTVVINRHPFPIKIEVDDREPAFNNVAIVLTERADMTPPTDRQVDGNRGVMSWIASYAPGEERNIVLTWRVRWPAKLGPIQGSETTQFFRFSGGATF